MSKVPRITGQDAVKAFLRAGFSVDRIRGSHHVMKKAGHRFRLSIPVHGGKTVGTGLLASQIENAGLTVDDFLAFLN